MNKKGFTLIELVSIIALIAIVATISFRIVTKRIKNSRNKLYNVLIADLEKAGEKYMLEHQEIDKYHINTLCISLTTLQEGNYLEKGDIKNPRNKQKMEGKIKVQYDISNNQYDITYSESCTQSIVSPVIETVLENENVKVVTDGDGLYETTDEYVYRGSNPKNYVDLNGNKNWRIVSIDKTTKMVKLIDLSDNLKQWPENGIISELNTGYDTGSYESINNLINTNSKWNTGKLEKIDTPTTVKSLEKQNNEYHTIGLLSVGEYIEASLDKNCYSTNNCESYLTTGKKYWLLNKLGENKEWYVDNKALKNISIPTNEMHHIYPVLYLRINASVDSGSGSEVDPYKIK